MLIRALVILSLLALGSYQICLALTGPAKQQDLRLEAGCEKYIRISLPRIIEDWRYPEYEKRATTELLLSKDPKVLRQHFAAYKKYLGRFHQLTDPVGSVRIENIRGTMLPVGYYVSRADFKNTSASITMKLVFRSGGWKYQAFTIRPSLALDAFGSDDD